MTVGIGRKFGRRITIATDTMISDSSAGKTYPIPGRLKGIVLSPFVSVAYAGHSDPALQAIRRARERLLITGEASDVANILIEASANPDTDVEFILAFHQNGVPFMHKITARGMSNDLDSCFIGDASIVSDVLLNEPAQLAEGHPDLGIHEGEIRFNNAFRNLFTKRGVALNEGVGGLPLSVLASPYGHTYQGHVMSMSWDRISSDVGITPAQHVAQRAGETAWSYYVLDGGLRGVAVVGVALPQAGLGFVYSPLTADDPERIRMAVLDGPAFIDSTPLQNAVRVRVNELSEADGGGVMELPATWERASDLRAP